MKIFKKKVFIFILFSLIVGGLGSGIWYEKNVKPQRLEVPSELTRYVINHLSAIRQCKGEIQGDWVVLNNVRVEHRSIEWDNRYCDLLDESILARKKQRNIKYTEHFPLVRMAHDEVSGLFVFRTSSPYYYSACYNMMDGIYGSIRTSAYCKQIIRGDLSETQKYKISPLSDEELRKYREDLSEQNAGLSNYTYQFVYQLDPDTRTISLFSPQSSELAQNVLRGFARNWGSYWRWLDVILNHDGGLLHLNKLDEPIFAVVQEEKNGELSLKVAPLDRDSYYSVEKIYSVIEMSKVAQVFTW